MEIVILYNIYGYTFYYVRLVIVIVIVLVIVILIVIVIAIYPSTDNYIYIYIMYNSNLYNVNPGLINPGWLIMVVPPNNNNWLFTKHIQTHFWILCTICSEWNSCEIHWTFKANLSQPRQWLGHVAGVPKVAPRAIHEDVPKKCWI